jgi:tRNA threonylcarbamoyl adenosine modification protein (Sua5/YciO/YrdC/YwlC family)
MTPSGSPDGGSCIDDSFVVPVVRVAPQRAAAADKLPARTDAMSYASQRAGGAQGTVAATGVAMEVVMAERAGGRVHRLDGSIETRARALDAARSALGRGEIALLPAEGLYGLHASAHAAASLERLRALKAGPAAGQVVRPFILLIGAPAHALPLVSSLPGCAPAILERVWPAPLTLLLPASDRVAPSLVQDGMVALRCPGQRFLRELLLLLPEPLASTSANRAGEPAPARFESILPDLLAGCGIAVDDGPLAGTGSTIARPEPDGRLTILRAGLWSPEGGSASIDR